MFCMKINFELRKNVSTAHAVFSFIKNIANTINSYVFVFASFWPVDTADHDILFCKLSRWDALTLSNKFV